MSIVIDEQAFVNDFVKMYYQQLMDDMKKAKFNILTNELIENESFQNWFNENWVADLWISYVSDKVQEMTDKQKTDFVVEYGIDNVLDMFRLIGFPVEEYTLNKMVWHIIDHWYYYSYFIKVFKNHQIQET